MSIATIVKGNTFSLAIPLQVYAVEEGEVVLRDYIPESGDNITIRLKGDRRNYTYIPSTNGNTAFIHLEGSEVVGVYAVEVEIVKDDDSKLTSMRFEQLSIVESIDELNEGQIAEGIEQGAIYLDPEIFIAGKDGRGIVSIDKTATSGLVDTYTITYTDNTTSAFNVTNGKDGINGQDGADGQNGVGIASIAKTATSGLIDTYTITLTNGTTYTYQVTNGKDGQDGTDGVGIVSITKTSTSGLVDTYTILLTNGTTTTFTVTNGSDATQVQSDWSQEDSSAVDYIKNKPILADVATSGSYDDLNDKPTIPAAQIQADWNQATTTAKDYIKNKPTIPAAQVQSNWNESDNTSKAYIQNKPTIPTVPTNVSAFNNDAGYLNNNFCPIIEDTRSSAVAAITGVAPFGTSGTISNGQRIILHLKYNTVNNGTLNLTLSDNTTTGAKDIMYQRRNGTSLAKLSSTYGQYLAGQYIEMVYNGTSGYWVTCAPVETNTVYGKIYQNEINAGTGTAEKVVTPQVFHDNAYIVDVPYTSSITALKANKMYDFGTVSSLTIPSLDATNDLVSNALNFYALRFIAGADNLSITFPTGVEVDDTPTINTGDYVEIMINKYGSNFYASIKVWQAQ